MSYWTNAKIKFWCKGELNTSEIQRLVGYACDYYDMHIITPWEKKECFLPIGSEGTFQIYVNKTTKKQTIFTVEGALRDVWDVVPIQTWFDEVTQREVEGYWGGKRRVWKAKGVAGRDSVGNELILKYKAK